MTKINSYVETTDEFLETFNHKKRKIDFLRYEHFLEEFGPFFGPTSTECVLFGQLTVIFVSICVLPVGLITFFFGECIERVVPKLLKFFAFLCCLGVKKLYLFVPVKYFEYFFRLVLLKN